MSQFITSSIAGSVFTLTLDRPEKKNAMTAAMRDEFHDLLQAANDSDEVAVIIITASDPVFSGGVDLEDAVNGGRQQEGKLDPGAACRQSRKPTLCVVNGACVTGGLELALGCDIIIASEQARFADTHAKLGLLPCFGMSALLPRRVGVAKAKELSATGAFIDAAEALRIGLVNHVVAHEQLLSFADELAQKIGRSNAGAVRQVFDLYEQGQGLSTEQALELEMQAFNNWQHDIDAANKMR